MTSLKVYVNFMNLEILLHFYCSQATTVPSLIGKMFNPSNLLSWINFQLATSSSPMVVQSFQNIKGLSSLSKLSKLGTLKFVFSLDVVMPLTFRKNSCCPVLWHLLKPYLSHVELPMSFSTLSTLYNLMIPFHVDIVWL